MVHPHVGNARAITIMEEAICDKELFITCKLLTGAEITADEAALSEMYRTLHVAHFLQVRKF
jgi:hypothetical protein